MDLILEENQKDCPDLRQIGSMRRFLKNEHDLCIKTCDSLSPQFYKKTETYRNKNKTFLNLALDCKYLCHETRNENNFVLEGVQIGISL